MSQSPQYVLALTSDASLMQALLSLSLPLMSIETDVSQPAARRQWETATVAIIGADMLADTVAAGLLPRVREALVVTHDGQAWPDADAVEQLDAAAVVTLPRGSAWLRARVAELLATDGMGIRPETVLAVEAGTNGPGFLLYVLSVELVAGARVATGVEIDGAGQPIGPPRSVPLNGCIGFSVVADPAA